jgi:CheY-like chemotaxis protein
LEADDKTIRGIGLGLSISKQLTDLMGGELLVNSEEGKGSTFTIKINLELVKASEPAMKLPTSTVVGYHGESKLILIADDNEENLVMLASMLEPLGFKIEKARSGREVLKTVSATQPDLILLDLLMPDMDGHEALQIIKQENKFPKIKIVGISAAIADKKRADKFIADCDDFILKPFVIQDLLGKIAKQLNIKWITEEGKRPVVK